MSQLCVCVQTPPAASTVRLPAVLPVYFSAPRTGAVIILRLCRQFATIVPKRYQANGLAPTSLVDWMRSKLPGRKHPSLPLWTMKMRSKETPDFNTLLNTLQVSFIIKERSKPLIPHFMKQCLIACPKGGTYSTLCT